MIKIKHPATREIVKRYATFGRSLQSSKRLSTDRVVILVLCSDERVSPAEPFGLLPGEAYKIRSPGNEIELDYPVTADTFETIIHEAEQSGLPVDVLVIAHHDDVHCDHGCAAWNGDVRKASDWAVYIAEQLNERYGKCRTGMYATPVLYITNRGNFLLLTDTGEHATGVFANLANEEAGELVRQYYPNMPRENRSGLVERIQANLAYQARIRADELHGPHVAWMFFFGKGAEPLGEDAIKMGPWTSRCTEQIALLTGVVHQCFRNKRNPWDHLIVPVVWPMRPNFGPCFSAAHGRVHWLMRQADAAIADPVRRDVLLIGAVLDKVSYELTIVEERVL